MIFLLFIISASFCLSRPFKLLQVLTKIYHINYTPDCLFNPVNAVKRCVKKADSEYIIINPHNGRRVPITPECREYLDLALNLPGKSEYVFHNVAGKAVTTTSYTQNLRKRCKRLGINTTNNHAFRVAFNSRLIELGIPASDRALVLGHSVATNERHYSKRNQNRLGFVKSLLCKKGA